MNARLVRVEVTALKDEVFYGNLVLELENGHEINIDSRPSDALALAVRSNIPILIATDVMDEAGIIPDQDIIESQDMPDQVDDIFEEISEESEDRLSVFEDFLDNINIDEEDSDEEEDED